MKVDKNPKISSIKKYIKDFISIPYKMITLITILNLVLVVLSVIQPRIYKLFVDEVLINKRFHLLIYIIVGYFVLFLLTNLFSLCVKYQSNKIMNRTNIKAQNNIYTNIFLIDERNIKQYNAEYFKSIIESDSTSYWKFINIYYLDTPKCAIICAVTLVLSFLINPILLLVAIIIVPISIFISRKIGNHFNQINREMFEIENKNKSYLSNNITKWREIKAYNIVDTVADKYEVLLEDEKKLKLKWIKAFNFNDIFYSVKNHFFLKIVPYFIGGLLIINHKISVGSLLMFISYFSMLVNNFDQILRNYSDYLGMCNCFKRLRSFTNVIQRENIDIDKIHDVSFHNIKFKYTKQKNNIINDLSLKINEKEKVLIKGKSGIGKSTVIKLVLNVEQPTDGEITINRLDIRKINPIILHKKIGVIMQESIFFNLSIYDNLRFFNSKVIQKDIEEACKQVNIHDFINTLPDRYNTVIGEKGVKLSGGQRQRLAIARIILYNPEFVIMDEATSALDYSNEQMIYKNLFTLFENKTIIIISHKSIDFPFTRTLEIK